MRFILQLLPTLRFVLWLSLPSLIFLPESFCGQHVSEKQEEAAIKAHEAADKAHDAADHAREKAEAAAEKAKDKVILSSS